MFAGVTANGSIPFVWLGANHATRMPIASYHERVESYVVVRRNVSPAFTCNRQFARVTPSVTSHETGPAGSKYFALDLKTCAVRAPRSTYRSSHNPPGWRWPPAAHERAAGRHRVLVLAPPAVRIVRRVRVGELAVRSAAPVHVEDRIDGTVLHVHPDRDHRGERLGVRGRDERDVVRDPHVERPVDEIVDHVVEEPPVARAVLVSVTARQRESASSLRRPRRIAQGPPRSSRLVTG